MKKLALIAPVFALVLAGCTNDPTIAARVDGQSIPVGDVTVFANFLCANASTNGQVVPMSAVNQTAITYLAGAAAMEALARASHVTISTPSGDSADMVAKLPTSQRARGQQLVDEVDAALQATGASSQQEAVATLYRAIQIEMAKGEFVNNPEFPIVDTSGGLTSGSLSEPLSSAAVNSVSASSSESYVAALPDSQKCG